MDFDEKISELRVEIAKELIPIVDGNYVLLGLPYYGNIGDVLIWEGTEEFLSTLSYKCLKRASIDTFDFGALETDTVILLQGGGNFGDTWLEHQYFRLKVIEKYPQNKIVILPQTVFYENDTTLQLECNILSKHSDLIICARDKCSYDLLKKNTTNQILLVPDMAFFICNQFVHRFRRKMQNKTLLLKRRDKELVDYDFRQYIKEEQFVEVRDWPSIEHNPFFLRILYKLVNAQIRVKLPIGDLFAFHYFKDKIITQGVNFILQYENIYTTRLHVAILSILLNKPFMFFDNSYGKNRSFFETWLSDLDGVEFITKKI